VGVRNDPDPRRQLLDPGRLQPGRVGALGVGATVECVQRRRGEKVGTGLVQGQVDIGERKPGAVGLTACVDGQRRRRHRRGGNLRGGSDILAARESGKCGLRSSMTRGNRRPSSLRPREPFGVRTVLRRRHNLGDLYLVDALLVDDLP
jgi:hypothetical protein